MARQTVGLSLLGLLAISASAFKLEFHDNFQCAGEFLGSWVGGVDQGCRQEFAGVAQSVTVLSTGKVDDAYIVQFYSSADCNPESVVALANIECLTVDSVTVQGYKSFNVVLNSVDTPTIKKPRALTGEMGLANREQTSAGPYHAHGQLATFDGIEYKWQQVSATGFRGILPHEWDDNIHVQNTAVLEPDPEFVKNMDLVIANISSGLEERGLVDGICKVSLGCVQAARDGGAVVAAGVKAWLIDAGTVAAAHLVSINDWLNENPFVSNLGIQALATGLQIKMSMGGKTSGDTKNVGDCSNASASTTGGKYIDAFASAVVAQAAAQLGRSVRVDVQDTRAGGDVISSITITVIECGQVENIKGCGGISAGFCPA